ncbi:MAG: tetratricopeptide repeat protein [Anaerolineales bacterium]|nr:tetratricopeptide repeat protein [Anaerolineales bacterium]
MSFEEQIKQLQAAIAAQENLRATLGDTVVDVAIAALAEKLAALQTQQGLAEQRKQVAVLFADFSGFTAMAEAMDSEDVASTMNAIWERLDAVIQAHGGWIDKHIGDAVMALFGVPIAREDDPERAIRSALEMQKALEKCRQEKNIHLEMRIAVHIGPVRLGGVGSKAEYTAMGDAVNTASYLQRAAPVGKVLVSQQAYRHVRGLFDVQMVEEVAIKGKSEKVIAYVITDAKQRFFRLPTRGVEGVETPMVGRQPQLAFLQQAYNRVVHNRQAERVIVTGEAGIGKSRLLDEFSATLANTPQAVSLYKARVDPQASHLPYALVRDLLFSRFEILASQSALVTRNLLEAGILQILGEGSQEKAHIIGHLIGLDFSASPYLSGILEEVRQIRDRAVHYLTQLFTADAQTRPLVIFVDDLHWSDEASLSLLETILNQCRTAPILLLVLTRPEFFETHPEWSEQVECSTRLDLQLLSARDTAFLVEQILGQAGGVSPDLNRLIFQGSEGNPFYIEELLKMLIEEGVIQHGATGWLLIAQEPLSIHVPQTLAGVLQARLDLLAVTELHVLQWGAVLGQVFWESALAQMQEVDLPLDAQLDTVAIAQALTNLEQKELIVERQGSAFAGEREFVFRHALLHNVTYESILKRRRNPLHACAAGWLVAHGGERFSENAGLIAFHYECAQEPVLAGEWYYRAGRQAQNTYAIHTAVDDYLKALALLPQTPACFPLRIACYEGMARMLFWQTRYSSAVEAYQEMLQESHAAGDCAAQSRALKALATVMDGQGEYHASLEYASQAVEIARAAEAQPELADALMWLGWAQHRLGEMQLAITLGEQSLELAMRLNESHMIASSKVLLGVVHGRVGNYERAIAFMEEALTHLRQVGDRARMASTLNNLSDVYTQLGDTAKGMALLQEALAIAREIGSRSREIVYLGNLAISHVGMGMYEVAEPELCQAIALLEEADTKFPDIYCSLVRACLGQNKTITCQGESIVSLAQRALDMAQELDDPAGISDAWSVMGKAMATVPAESQKYSPSACFEKAIHSLPETGADREKANHLRDWARYELAYGDPLQGEAMWRQAYLLFLQLGLSSEAASMGEMPPAESL